MKPLVNFVEKYPLMNLARVVFLGLANLIGAAFYLEKPWVNRQRLLSFLELLHDIMSLFLMTPWICPDMSPFAEPVNDTCAP